MGEKCQKCGNELNDNVKFCSKCGMRVDYFAEESGIGGQVKRIDDVNIQESVSITEKNKCKKWWQKTGGIIFWLIIFFPVGLYLMWKYANWKKGVKIALSVVYVCTIMGFFFEDGDLGSTEMEPERMTCNVEKGLGQMGARFDMDLETFTEKFNTHVDILNFDNWYFDGQISQEGGKEMFDMYFYQISDKIMINAVIESSTGKINTVNIGGPFNDGSDEETQILVGLISGTLSVLTDNNQEKSLNILSEVIDNNSTGLPVVYENICMKFVSSTTCMIAPVSDDVLETMQYIEID